MKNFLENYFQDINHRKLWFCLTMVVLLISLPLMMRGITIGHDFSFHLMRIEGIAKELAAGVFPVRLSSDWLNGYGYPVSIYYGDILLYLPAFLKNMGMSVVDAYKYYVLFINVITVLIAYYSFKKIFNNPNLGFLVMLAYVTATYRYENVYVRAAVGEYTAMAFMPLVLMAVIKVLDDNKQWLRYSLLLSLGLTGIITSHVLSVILTMVGILLLCLMRRRDFCHLNVLKAVGTTVGLTACLNAWFLVPFLDYFLHVPVKQNVIGEALHTIQFHGTYPAQYFGFFQNPFGFSLEDVISTRMGLTPGMLLMFVLFLGLYYICVYDRQYNEQIINYTVPAIILLYMASNIFPWDWLVAHSKIMNAVAQVQFPWRFIGVAIPMMCLLLGALLKNKRCQSFLVKSVVVISVFTTLVFLGFYCNNAELALENMPKIKTSATVAGGEYLRAYKGSDGKSIVREQDDLDRIIADTEIKESWGVLYTRLMLRKGTDMVVFCQTGSKGGTLEFPFFNYKNYVIRDNQNNCLKVVDGNYGKVKTYVKPYYKGKITVSFEPPLAWRYGELLSLFSVLGLVFVCNRKRLLAWKRALAGKFAMEPVACNTVKVLKDGI